MSALKKIQDHENSGHARPCSSILLYQSERGPVNVAATSKVDAALKKKGGLKQIHELADEHG